MVTTKRTHAYWLESAREWLRGGPTEYPKEHEMLFTLLKWEAERMHEREPEITALDHLHQILDELGLKLTVPVDPAG